MKNNITAADMFRYYDKRIRREIDHLELELKKAREDRERIYRLQIKGRQEQGLEVPAFIFQQWEHRLAECKQLERDIEERSNKRRLSYSEFRNVITEFNLKLIDRILEGYEFTVPYRLGKLSIKKIKRRFDKPMIDWGTTMKLKNETGETKLVYFTDDYFCRWYWYKRACHVTNKSVYFFKPTTDNRTKKGATNKLSQLLKTNEYAHLNFKMA